MWERPLVGRQAAAILNKYEIGGPRQFAISNIPGFKLCEPHCNVTQILPQHKDFGVQTQQSNLAFNVNPSGTVLLVLTPTSSYF